MPWAVVVGTFHVPTSHPHADACCALHAAHSLPPLVTCTNLWGLSGLPGMPVYGHACRKCGPGHKCDCSSCPQLSPAFFAQQKCGAFCLSLRCLPCSLLQAHLAHASFQHRSAPRLASQILQSQQRVVRACGLICTPAEIPPPSCTLPDELLAPLLCRGTIQLYQVHLQWASAFSSHAARERECLGCFRAAHQHAQGRACGARVLGSAANCVCCVLSRSCMCIGDSSRLSGAASEVRLCSASQTSSTQ